MQLSSGWLLYRKATGNQELRIILKENNNEVEIQNANRNTM